jgi:bifunctional non-homologous end joining protein LigD
MASGTRCAIMGSVELPKIDPLRPVKKTVVPAGPGWIYELKLDGFRGVLSIENGRGFFTSKTSKNMKRFQDLADALARVLPVKSAILDGEIIVMGEEGPDFYALMLRRGAPAYAAFDLLWLNGKDLRSQPLWRRKRALQKVIASSPVGYVDHVDNPGLFQVAATKDLEGIVAKRKGDPYTPDTMWIKVKVPGYSQAEGRGELFHGRK